TRQSELINWDRLQALEEWQWKTSTTLKQVNGQRTYGGPPPYWTGPVPGPGCEVYIGQIPRDIFEDRLIPIFQSVALLYEFRLMMNFSGQNRGFAFAKYKDPATAVRVIRALNHYPLQEGVQLVVRRSTEKRQLCLRHLPSGMGHKEVLRVLRQLLDGVEGVTLKACGPMGNDIFALVDFSSHYAASMAKKLLTQEGDQHFGASFFVLWSPKSREQERRIIADGLKQGPLPPPPPPLRTQGFSWAVGAPAPNVKNGMAPKMIRRLRWTPHGAADLFQWLCEVHGLGVPMYEMHCHHTSRDGFLHFRYSIIIPQLPVPLSGAVQILPSLRVSTLKKEVHEAVARQGLATLCWWCPDIFLSYL
ncbi:dead end protein 1-like, partial [Colossoma macropomum]|uniref:dead end protein 1-like n=1 Tax=Colossoma macropomum TaxID=42526 RepID=UPI001864A9AE